MPLQVAIVGTGNVGFHLAKQLHQSSNTIVKHIVSRDISKATSLIKEVGASECTPINLQVMESIDCDVLILAIPDQSIAALATSIVFPANSVIAHTSGSQSMQVLGSHDRYGVLYPLQTFTRNHELDFSEVPVLIEGNDEQTLSIIRQLAASLSSKVKVVSSDDRQKIHLAAVFACNFSNHLFALAEELLFHADLNLADIKHLLQETVDKAVDITARKAQTGPAIRGDQMILDKHLKLLAPNEDKLQVYRLLSEQITSLSKK